MVSLWAAENIIRGTADDAAHIKQNGNILVWNILNRND